MIKRTHTPHSLPLPRSPREGPEHDAALPWHILPSELKIKVMRQLVHCGSITDYDYQPGQAIRRAGNEPWVSRQSLAAACLASRQLEIICKPLLYESVALKDCRELLCLLRSLANNPRLRARVRRFAWVHLVHDVDINQPVVNMSSMLEGLVSECRSVWPKTPRDRIVAELFQLWQTDPASFFLWKVLGVVISTLPRVQSLFITHGGLQLDCNGANKSAEHNAIAHLLTPALLPASTIWQEIDRSDPSGSGPRIRQRNPRSLRMLEEIIIDSWDTEVGEIATGVKTARSLWYLMLNCPHLRRVELKGEVPFNAMLDPMAGASILPLPAVHLYAPPNFLLLPQPVGAKVRELVIHRSEAIQWDFMLAIFPNLERLVTIFQDGDWRSQHHRPLPPISDVPFPIIPPDMRRSIPLDEIPLRSLTVTGFLSNNGQTTEKGYTSNADWGPHWVIKDLAPLFSPRLLELPLTELTTDCVWLFGREDPSKAYEARSLLPSSLNSLHLIDYWAVPVDEDVVEGGERLGYYPVFPSGLSPICFLAKVFAILYNSYATEQSRLQSITLSSPIFDEAGRWSTPDTQPIDRDDVRMWKENFRNSFSRIGVRFSFTTMRELERTVRSSWARM